MRNKDYSGTLLAASVLPLAEDASIAVAQVTTLATSLTLSGFEYDGYAHDHAAEILERAAKKLEEAARRLRSLTFYTNYPPVKNVEATL